MVRSWLRRRRGRGGPFEGDFGAEGFEALDQASFQRGSVTVIEVEEAEILERLLPGEHVRNDDEDRVTNGDGGFLQADAGNETVQLGCQIGLAMAGGMGCFGQADPQPGTPLACSSARPPA